MNGNDGLAASLSSAKESTIVSVAPLRIAEVAPPLGGWIGITFAPGKKQVNAFSGRHDRDLAVDLDVIKAWNATAVVTLVEAAELKALRIEGLGEAVRSRNMNGFIFPFLT